MLVYAMQLQEIGSHPDHVIMLLPEQIFYGGKYLLQTGIGHQCSEISGRYLGDI